MTYQLTQKEPFAKYTVQRGAGTMGQFSTIARHLNLLDMGFSLAS